MGIKQLKKYLDSFTQSLKSKDRKLLGVRLTSLKSVFPFNEYEYTLMYLLNKKVISFKEYDILRENYIKSNTYRELYGIAPRIFGDQWAKKHLMDIDARFKEPSANLDSNFQGEYDLYLQNNKQKVKLEVKASRATNTKIRGKLEAKALNFSSKEPFWMNFQQLKLDLADAFVFIGVWTDRILYWVLTNEEVKVHPIRSHQHRGGVEFQIGIRDYNIEQFKKNLVEPTKLVDTILRRMKVKSQ